MLYCILTYAITVFERMDVTDRQTDGQTTAFCFPQLCHLVQMDQVQTCVTMSHSNFTRDVHKGSTVQYSIPRVCRRMFSSMTNSCAISKYACMTQKSHEHTPSVTVWVCGWQKMTSVQFRFRFAKKTAVFHSVQFCKINCGFCGFGFPVRLIHLSINTIFRLCLCPLRYDVTNYVLPC